MTDYTSSDLWTLKETRRRWTSSNGWEDVYVWEGPSEGLSNWLALQPPGITSIDIQTDIERVDEFNSPQGYCRVTVTYISSVQDPPQVQSGSPPNDGRVQPPIWTVQLEEVEIGLLETEKTQALRARDPEWLARIIAHCEAWLAGAKKAAQAGTTLPALPTVTETNPPADATSEELTYAGDLISLYCNNPDITKIIYAPVLEKTETLLRESTLVASYSNVGKIYTWSALLNEVAASENTTTDQCSLWTAPLIDDVTRSQLSTWYWLKTAPEVRPASGGTWQITQRWKGVRSFEPYLYDLIS